jgi:hypothetical protein
VEPGLLMGLLQQQVRNRDAGGGGPDVNYYGAGWTTDDDDTASTHGGWNHDSFCYGGLIAVAEAGTCTEIAVKVDNASGSEQGIKIALWDAAEDLITEGSSTIAGGTTEWVTVVVDVPVSVADYYVLYVAEDDQCFARNNDEGDGQFATWAYASSAPDPMDSRGASLPAYGARMFVD